MTHYDNLNTRVTDAIIRAERLLDDALEAWREVAQLETKLSEQPAGVERDIAQRGSAYAELKARILETLCGPRDKSNKPSSIANMRHRPGMFPTSPCYDPTISHAVKLHAKHPITAHRCCTNERGQPVEDDDVDEEDWPR